MNPSRLLFALLALGLALAPAAQAVPTRLTSDAGEVRDIRFATGSAGAATVYAATQGGGVFKSTNSGSTWAPTGLNNGYAWKIAVAPAATARVYAATDAGLFRSTDSGANWTQLTFDPARTVAIDPASTAGTDTLLLGVTGQGIFRSSDNGATFVRVSAGLDSMDVTHIVYQATGVAYAVLDCNYQDLLAPLGQGGWGGVFRSGNTNAAAASVAWINYNNGGSGGATLGTPPNCVKALAANASTVYVGTYAPFGADGSVYRSTGAVWIGPGAPNGAQEGHLFGVESLAIDRIVSTTVHAGAFKVGPWSSTTNGVWTGKVLAGAPPAPTNADVDVWTRIYAVETIPGAANTMLVAAKGIGIMRTTDGGANWGLSVGITADRVRALANHASAAPNTFWMALVNGGAMKSTNAGGLWSEFFRGWEGNNDIISDAISIAADPTNASNVLVGTRGDGIWSLDMTLYSGQGGWKGFGGILPTFVTWNNGADNKPQSILMPDGNLVYATFFDAAGAGAGGLVRSQTGAANLVQTPYPDTVTGCTTPPSASGGALKVVQTSNSVAYLLRFDGLPYRSTNNFATNTATCVNAPFTGFERLAFRDLTERPTDANVLVAATNKGIYRSVDAGLNWARVTVAGLPTQVLASVAYLNASLLYGIDRSGGFFCSTDNGSNWQSVSLGTLPKVPFRDIKILNGAVHILTDGGGVYTGFAATCP